MYGYQYSPEQQLAMLAFLQQQIIQQQQHYQQQQQQQPHQQWILPRYSPLSGLMDVTGGVPSPFTQIPQSSVLGGWQQQRLTRPIEPLYLALNQSVIPQQTGESINETWMPRLDVIDDGKFLIYLVEVPGVKKDQVQVELRADQIVVAGVKVISGMQQQQLGGSAAVETLRHQERPTGRFLRIIPLVQRVKVDQALVKLDNGILEIRLNKVEDEVRKVNLK